jgi:hypothetical protein
VTDFCWRVNHVKRFNLDLGGGGGFQPGSPHFGCARPILKFRWKLQCFVRTATSCYARTTVGLPSDSSSRSLRFSAVPSRTISSQFQHPRLSHSPSRIIQFHSNCHRLKLISGREIPMVGHTECFLRYWEPKQFRRKNKTRERDTNINEKLNKHAVILFKWSSAHTV